MRYFVTIKLRRDFMNVVGNEITVGVRAIPEKGKANEEAMRKIAEHFGVSKSRVRIVAGGASRRKIVDIL